MGTNLTEWDEDGLFVACFLWGGAEMFAHRRCSLTTSRRSGRRRPLSISTTPTSVAITFCRTQHSIRYVRASEGTVPETSISSGHKHRTPRRKTWPSVVGLPVVVRLPRSTIPCSRARRTYCQQLDEPG